MARHEACSMSNCDGESGRNVVHTTQMVALLRGGRNLFFCVLLVVDFNLLILVRRYVPGMYGTCIHVCVHVYMYVRMYECMMYDV